MAWLSCSGSLSSTFGTIDPSSITQMKEFANQFSEAFDHHVSRHFLSVPPLRDGDGEVIAFLFHRLFTEEELSATVYPHEKVTVQYFDRFLAQCRALGYDFVTPSDILRGHHGGKRSVMITFDDGYWDNLRALPLLERYGARATFFVAPGHIAENRRFWWDALYANGESGMRRYQELRFDDAKAEIQRKWPDAFRPSGDLDRPMSLGEFLTLAGSEYAEIGHHSFNHTTLVGRDVAYVAYEIQTAREFFLQHLGYNPTAIAYPNGVFSNELIDVCITLGLKIGFTCDFRSNILPREPRPEQMMRLGRVMISGVRDASAQITSAALRYSLKKTLHGFKRVVP
jgi:peptidoglycan/xylan/chitin deacetylase (PgdA/CDA1 family)